MVEVSISAKIDFIAVDITIMLHQSLDDSDGNLFVAIIILKCGTSRFQKSQALAKPRKFIAECT